MKRRLMKGSITRLNMKSVVARDTIAGERYSFRRLELFSTARMISKFRSVPAILSTAVPRPAIIAAAPEYAKLVSLDKYAKRAILASTVIQHTPL